MLFAEVTASQWILPAALLVLLVVMMIFPMIRNKKQVKQYQEMQNSLKAGDKVQTIGGIIGRIISIKDKNGVKTVILESGDKKNKTVIEIDANAIAGPITLSNQQTVNATETVVNEEDETETDNSSETNDELLDKIEKPSEADAKKSKKSKNK